MNRVDLTLRARSLLRDLSNTQFRETDVVNYLNEGIERIGQIIPELGNMGPLNTTMAEVQYLPKAWQHIIAIYGAARLATQDERHYQAGVFMNEFETKLELLHEQFQNGEVEFIDPVTGLPIIPRYMDDHVRNVYFDQRKGGKLNGLYSAEYTESE